MFEIQTELMAILGIVECLIISKIGAYKLAVAIKFYHQFFSLFFFYFPGLMYRTQGTNSQTQVLLPQSYQLSGAQIYQVFEDITNIRHYQGRLNYVVCFQTLDEKFLPASTAF